MFNLNQKLAMGCNIRYEGDYYEVVHMVSGNLLKPAFSVVAKHIHGPQETPRPCIIFDSRLIRRTK